MQVLKFGGKKLAKILPKKNDRRYKPPSQKKIDSYPSYPTEYAKRKSKRA